MVRRRDWLIDKKIGSVIRMRRLKLGLNQTELGDALGVSFQQIQKYENGTNAVASTRVPDLCRVIEISPNDLFGVSDRMNSEVSQLSSWARIRTKQPEKPMCFAPSYCHSGEILSASQTTS